MYWTLIFEGDKELKSLMIIKLLFLKFARKHRKYGNFFYNIYLTHCKKYHSKNQWA